MEDMLSFPPWKDEIMVWRMSERSIFPSPFTSLNPIAPLEILLVIALVTAPVKSPEMSKPEFDAFALVTVFVPVDFDAVFFAAVDFVAADFVVVFFSAVDFAAVDFLAEDAVVFFEAPFANSPAAETNPVKISDVVLLAI